ncbi:TIGR03067 domain-containing protein [Aquisphaera insulae]|uniref:TIGR03067 domain-containing protein n=1 Tax=Aquisphaera insulae TaxID=2712864 RepID=UPI0013E9BE5C|nr:TIGR03067 domain-containing protein [Aquisphaera insulae]
MISRPGATLAGILTFVGLSLIAAADEPKQAPVLKIEGDLKAMQGEWITTDEKTGGESVWKFDGEHVTLKTPTRSYDMRIKVDSEAKPEKRIDFDVSDTSPNAKGYKAQGIYKFDEGTLKICFSDGEAGRPKEFKTDFGKSFAFDLKRKK